MCDHHVSIFGTNALRACQTEVVLPLLKNPLDVIKDHCPTWDDFVAMVSHHPAVANACRASAGFKVDGNDCRYTSEYSATNATNSFSNRFDQKLYQSFSTLIKSREDATNSRDEHEAIMATRPPPTPPPEEYVDENGGGGDGEVEYDEDGNPIEREDDAEGYEGGGGGGAAASGAVAPPPRPRKTRAQRREEEKQRKEDEKRKYEVEVKEHQVACLEQKLANALCANAVRIALAP